MDLRRILDSTKNESIYYLNFNQDYSCFFVGKEKGFMVFNTSPLIELINLNSNPSNSTTTTTTIASTSTSISLNKPTLENCPDIVIVEGLYKSNLIAFVGKDINSYFSPNKVILYDMSNESIIAEIQYELEIKAVRLTKYGIIVVLPTQTFIYNDHKDPKLITTIETCYNEKGLIAVASFNKEYSHGIIIALPGKVQGEIQILTLQSNVNNNNNNSNSSTSNLSSFNSLISRIKAHKSSLACLSISLNGELIASASELGTLIRVFNVETRQKTNEFRRGMDKAQIYCINFNKYLNKICVSSNKGTIHIFDLDDSPSRFIRERSSVKFSLPYSNICAFFNESSSSSSQSSLSPTQKEVIESNEIELVSLCSNGYIYYLTCTTLRPPPNTDESNEISHQSYKIQKKKFFKTDNDESEEDNEEDSYNTSI